VGDGEHSGPYAFITPDAAVLGAQAGFKHYGLLARPGWAPLLTPFLDQRVRPIEPLLVHRLDARDPARAYYYLVSFGGSVSTIGAVARVNAISGEYQEAMAIPRSEKWPWGGIAVEWSTTTLKAGHRAVDVNQALIWTPCVESATPYYPFRVVTVDGHRRYIRVDGQTFDKLTDLRPYPL
jgi:hypothetical protein